MATKRQKEEATVGICICLFLVLIVSLFVGCSNTGRPVLYVFTSPHCMPCLQDYPTVKRIIETGMVTTEIVVAEDNPKLMRAFQVSALPTYILIYDDRVIWRTHQAGVALRKIEQMRRAR